MSLTKFRNLNPGTHRKSDPKARLDPTLSFRKLAAQDSKGIVKSPVVGTRNHRNGKNRRGLYDHACKYLSQVLNAVKNGKDFTLAPGFRIIQEMAAIDHPGDELFIMAIHRDERFQYVIHHSVNVAIYALAMAKDLGFSKQRRLEVAMAALVHDLGMAVIPDSILYKQEELSQKEIDTLRQRPNYSYKILRSFGDEFAYLAESAAQVYERVDGSGYPRGMEGDEIHEYAQIIGLLDMYEALIHSRPQREKLTHFTAVKEIIIACKNRFQRRHLKSLLSIFTAFPIYSFVRLNSNAIGKVIETYPEQPLRPKLRILYDSQKRKVLTERIVVLPDNPLLNIVDSVPVSEIQELSKMQSV